MKNYTFKFYILETNTVIKKPPWWKIWIKPEIITENTWKPYSFKITERESQFIKETFEREIEPQQSVLLKMLSRGRDNIRDLNTYEEKNIKPFMILRE